MRTDSLSLKNRIRQKLDTTLEVPNDVLQEIFKTFTVLDENDQIQPLNFNISIPHANALYRTILKNKPRVVLEVGMAYGISSLVIGTALNNITPKGRFISIDPFQSEHYHNIGMHNLQRGNLSGNHQLIEQVDYLALPKLIEEGLEIDLAYIDGYHTFDYTLLDFFYIDRMLKVGGIVGFNDCALPAVKRVIGYVRTHRKYQKIDVGLRPNFMSSNLFSMLRQILTLSSKSDRYFQKREDWEPEWNYYRRF